MHCLTNTNRCLMVRWASGKAAPTMWNCVKERNLITHVCTVSHMRTNAHLKQKSTDYAKLASCKK